MLKGKHDKGMCGGMCQWCGFVLLAIGVLWLLEFMGWFVIAAGFPWGPVAIITLGLHKGLPGLCPCCK